jgi:hypothetical protein
MIANIGSCCRKTTKRSGRKEKATEQVTERREPREVRGIIDHKVLLLSVAGAAVASDCDPCLREIVPELEDSGISESDIRRAVEEGWFLGADAKLGTDVLKKACYHPN